MAGLTSVTMNNPYPGGTGFPIPPRPPPPPPTRLPPTSSVQKGNMVKKDQSKSKDAGREAPAVPTPAPAWSELKTKAGKERKRLPLACKSCRRKKVRCSGETPACKHCLRARIPCVYKVTQRKATPRTDYMTMLDKRLKRMEERVIKLVPHPDSAKVGSIARASVKPPQTSDKNKPMRKKSAIDAFAPADLQVPLTTPILKDHSETSSVSEGKDLLPDLEIQEHLAETYFDACYGQPYLLLHRPSFMRRLREGSLPAVLMLAVCAISARFSSHPRFANEQPTTRGEQWASEARKIAARSFSEPNLTTVIVVTLLALYDFGGCQGGRAWMQAGIAMRMCYALQLNEEYQSDSTLFGQHKNLVRGLIGEKDAKPPVSSISFTDQEIRRRAMWACYLMDCFNSSGSKRPIFDHLEHIHIQLPIKESYFQLDVPGRTEDLQGTPGTADLPSEADDTGSPRENMGVAAYLVKAIALWSNAIKFSSTLKMHNDQLAPWAPDSEFAKIEASVRQFGQNLPEALRYSPENLRTHDADKLGPQFALLHIVYQQVILFIFKFTIPAFPGSKIPPEMPREFLLKTRRTAVDAACKITKILNDAKGIQLTAPFASYCTFASSTVHIWGMFSKDAKLAEICRANLSINMRYLSHMRRFWSMIHYMTESLKDLYRQHADAAKNNGMSDARKLSEEKIMYYGNLVDLGISPDASEESGIKPEKSPGSKPDYPDPNSKHRLLSIGDLYQGGHSTSPQPSSGPEIPNRPLKRGKMHHQPSPSISDKSAVKLETSSLTSHASTPPETNTSTSVPSLIEPPQSKPQNSAGPSASHFATSVNPYLDRELAISFSGSNPSRQPFPSGRFPVQPFDRQLIYGAYAQEPTFPANSASMSFDANSFPAAASAATTTATNHDVDLTILNGAVYGALDPGFASQFGLDAAGAAGTNRGTAGGLGDASIAWLTPFHMVPPLNFVQPEFNATSMEFTPGDKIDFSAPNEFGQPFWET